MQVEGVGDVIAKKLIQHCGNATEVFASKKTLLQKIDGIGSVAVQKLQDKTVFSKAEAELQFLGASAGLLLIGLEVLPPFLGAGDGPVGPFPHRGRFRCGASVSGHFAIPLSIGS